MMRNGQLPTQVKQSPTQTDEWGTMPTDTAQCVSMAGKRCTEPKGTWTHKCVRGQCAGLNGGQSEHVGGSQFHTAVSAS